MLLVAIQTFFTVPEDSKIAADALTLTDANVRERAVLARAAAIVGEMHAEWRAVGRWVVREVAGVGRVGAGPLEEIPADGNL